MPAFAYLAQQTDARGHFVLLAFQMLFHLMQQHDGPVTCAKNFQKAA